MNRFPKLIPVGLAMLVMMLITACGESVEPTTETAAPRLVRTMTVSQADDFQRREFPGVVDAAQKADLSFRVAGKLVTIDVVESDELAAGQVIARLDPEDFKTRLNSVRADYERAKADFERAEGLVEDGFISRTDFDKLKAQYANAQSQLDTAERDLESTRLVAPFDGVVAQRHVENFEEVNAKQPIITLHDLSMLQVKIDIPESVMIRVRRGVNPRQGSATFEGIPSQEFPLTLLEVSSEPDPASRTYEATFTMSAIEDRVILPGMTATVVVQASHFESPAGQVILPANVVMEDQNGRFVWVVEPTENGLALIRRRAVETGGLSAEGLVVYAGVSSGDQVVTAGMSQLVEGQPVRTDTVSSP
jgi:RND family efflux transporter MFP subunit